MPTTEDEAVVAMKALAIKCINLNTFKSGEYYTHHTVHQLTNAENDSKQLTNVSYYRITGGNRKHMVSLHRPPLTWSTLDTQQRRMPIRPKAAQRMSV